MKKFMALAVIVTLILACLSGCGTDKRLPEGLSGKDAAGILLANERLNSKLLKNSGNIFENGSETLSGLAKAATVSLASNVTVSGTSAGAELLLGTKYEALDGSVVEVDGTIFRWSGFEEYSNSYNYFLNLTNGISSTALMGAELIDNVKKYVRVLDKWVSVSGGEEYYLHVEQNREILYSRSEDDMRICIRSKTADGSNLYEVFILNNNGGYTRMVYSEGKICEYSYIFEDFNHNFLAVNNKGFWEVVDVGRTESNYNVSCMVIKNDICYDAIYDPSSQSIAMLKVISSDRATDIMQFSPGGETAYITVNLQGFSGYDYFELKTSADKISSVENPNNSAEIYYTDVDKDSDRAYWSANTENVVMVLKNGKTVKSGDIYASGKVEVKTIRVDYFTKEPEEGSHIYSGGYTPEISITVNGASFDEQMANFELFLSELGLTCNRNMNYVKSGITQALEELLQFTKYHEWNESPITTLAELDRGWENNLAKHNSYKAMYENIKNAEKIKVSSRMDLELYMSFSPLETNAQGSVTNSGLTVTVSELKLTATDTLLFVAGEEYSVFYAFLGADGTLNHIELQNPEGTVYAAADTFTVSGDAAFDIPLLAEGEYTLVAYVSTKDGIRSSDYIPLKFTSITALEEKSGHINVSLRKGEADELIVKYLEATDIEIEITGSYTASAMYEALSKEIYNFGFVDKGAKLEVLLEDGSFAEVADTENTLASGTYRLKYSIKNGDSIKEGYILAVYTAQ